VEFVDGLTDDLAGMNLLRRREEIKDEAGCSCFMMESSVAEVWEAGISGGGDDEVIERS
jgi:hypothetical protein